MHRYSAAQARKHWSDLLDSAELGESVVIERRGVRFELRAKPVDTRDRTRPELIEYLDPAIEEGGWTWSFDEGGLQLIVNEDG